MRKGFLAIVVLVFLSASCADQRFSYEKDHRAEIARVTEYPQHLVEKCEYLGMVNVEATCSDSCGIMESYLVAQTKVLAASSGANAIHIEKKGRNSLGFLRAVDAAAYKCE